VVGAAAVVIAILAVGVLIIVHEAGHYLAAKWSGMRVSRFSIGFGPVLYKTQRGETEFALSAVPLGGYVQIDGMNPEDGTDANDPGAYHAKPFFAKFGTVLAGPAANYLLGFLLFFLFYAFLFAEPVPPVRVTDVVDGRPAAEAGLKEGDLIIGVEGQDFETVQGLTEAIQASEGSPVPFVVERDGTRRVLPVIPELEELSGRYLIGIRFEGSDTRPNPLGPVRGVQVAALQLVNSSYGVLLGLSALIGQGLGLDAVDGPIGIVRDLSSQVERSSARALAYIARLSVVLGFFNLLPVPALDGARLMFLLVGAVRRRPVEPRLEAWIHLTGFALLFTVLVLVSIRDVFE
jgi:regulator of sigma E protease